MKKNRHWLLTMAMLLSSIMVSAHDFEVDGIYYNILSSSEKTVEVTYEGDYPHLISYTPEYSGEVVIPASVTYNSTPYDVVSINEYTFSNCTNLTSVSIPSSVTTIEECIFEACNNLVTIIVDENNKVFDSRDNCNAIITTVNNTIVQGCIGTIIPSSVTEIGKKAFATFYKGLTSVTIPENIVRVGEQAFAYCHELSTIHITFGVEEIGEGAFFDCKELLSISLPNSVTKIGKDAFYCCENLTSAVIPDNIPSIDEATFYGCRKMESISIGSGVTMIGASAFQDCVMLSSVVIPANVTEIATSAFIYCSNLSSIALLNPNAPSLGDMVFNGVPSSAVLYVPYGATQSYVDAGWGTYFATIEEKPIILASGDCSDPSAPNTVSWEVSYTDNPDNCTLTIWGNGTINPYVSIYDGDRTPWEEYKSDLKTLIIEDGITYIPDEAFDELNYLETLTIGKDVSEIHSMAFEWCSSLKSISVDENNTTFDSRDNCNAIIFTSSESLILGCCNTAIPEGVKKIAGGAFIHRADMQEIEFPSTLIEIGGEAFSYTSLDKVFIPASVVSVAGNSFYGVALTSIVVDEENTKYDSREDCNSIIETATNKLVLGCTNTTIPEGVEVIAEFAFTSSWDPEKVLSIPSSVTSIEALAFYHGMTSALKEVVCYATTPPVLAESAFCLSADNIPTLRVPASSVEAYKAADGWKEFYIEPIGGVLVTSLTLDVTEVSLAPNETLSLTATLLPEDVTNPALSWASSNESVATVDANGVVTAVADGEAIITVSTTDGSDLSTSCKVVVVTEEVVEYDNMIYFEDVTVFTNSSVNHPLQLKNTVDMTAVQFDLYLPEGVTLATDARGKYAITFNADRADNTTHTLSSALQSDGAIRVLCYSTESYEFLGSEGAIFYFPLEIAEMEDGDYDMVIKNIVLTDVSGTKYEIPSMTSTITVLNVAPGDCNGDNTIDVADIVVLANSILGNTADGFVEKAADYNADGAVDVADIVNIANYILNGNNAAARALVREMMSTRAVAAGYSFDILPFVLDAAGSKTIAIELTDPTESFTAFQCDLYLPEGVSVDKDKRGRYAFSFNEERTDASYHTLSGSQQADGAVRMLCYSTDSEVFLGADGALVYIPLTADASLKEGVYEFSIASTVLTYRNGEKVTPETYKGSIVVGDGGEVKDVKLYGRYTSEVLDEYTAAFGTNAGITSLNLTEALYLPADGSLTTGNPNTIVYLAEGDALANENNVVVGDESANLMLADGYAFSAPVAFNASQASYERELAEGKYGTIVLPFAPNTDDYVFYALTSAGDDALIFDEVQSPVANTPYLYKLRDGKSATQITNNEVAVSSELTPTETATWQMVGSFTNQTIVASKDADTYYYVYTSSDNQLHKVTNTLTVKPYRAYFTTNSTNGTQLAIRTRGGEETLIDAAEVEGLSPEVYYDLSGRRVDNPVKGVYIVNGKKVVF